MASRFGWTKRRARRLQCAFGISRRLALVSANDDWNAFRGVVKAEPAPRSCDSLGVCQLHATGTKRCNACPYRHIPQAKPLFAPGVIEGPHWPRTGWRASLVALWRWLSGPTPW